MVTRPNHEGKFWILRDDRGKIELAYSLTLLLFTTKYHHIFVGFYSRQPSETDLEVFIVFLSLFT